MNIKYRTVKFGGKEIRLYTTSYKGKKHESATVREAILYAMGYGYDQAAELRYAMRRKVDEDKSNEA